MRGHYTPDVSQVPTHTPVLLDAALSVLQPEAGERVLDVTLGLGGHAAAFLERIGPSGSLTGLDADPKNLTQAQKKLSSFPNVTCLHANFRDLPSLALPHVDVIFADLGLSSPHVDDPERGFSFRTDAPLDLRFDPTTGPSAAQWLQIADPEELTRVLREYGELPHPHRLALLLKEQLPQTTFALVRAVEEVLHWRAKAFLPQVFQALRIAVNDELGALDTLLAYGPSLLKEGGRMGIISYHSLEDRRVKQVFRSLTTAHKDPESGQDAAPAAFVSLTRKALTPSAEEIAGNSRSRSAKFRAIRKRKVQS